MPMFSFVSALSLSLLGTWLVRQMANRFGLLDRPGLHKQHEQITPTLGGVAIFAAFLLLSWYLVPSSAKLSALLLASTLVAVVGVMDDLFKVRATYKLAALAIASVILFLGKWPVGLGMPFPLSLVTAFLWVGLVSSAFNGVDNADGAAGGLALISSLACCLVSFIEGRSETAQLSAILAGCALGFLYWNFPAPRASIFLGDSGSLLIGLLLACFTIDSLPLLLSPMLIAVPLFDFLFILVIRGIHGQYRTWTDPITMCARDHVFHRLVASKLSPRKAVLLMYTLAAVFALAATISWMAGGFPALFSCFKLALLAVVFIAIRLALVPLPPDVYSAERSAR